MAPIIRHCFLHDKRRLGLKNKNGSHRWKPFTFWCRWPESNWRPSHYECAALPTELHRRGADYSGTVRFCDAVAGLMLGQRGLHARYDAGLSQQLERGVNGRGMGVSRQQYPHRHREFGHLEIVRSERFL